MADNLRVTVAINTNRITAKLDGGLVIYINSMRLNKLRAVHKYLCAGLKGAVQISLKDEVEQFSSASVRKRPPHRLVG